MQQVCTTRITTPRQRTCRSCCDTLCTTKHFELALQPVATVFRQPIGIPMDLPSGAHCLRTWRAPKFPAERFLVARLDTRGKPVNVWQASPVSMTENIFL